MLRLGWLSFASANFVHRLSARAAASGGIICGRDFWESKQQVARLAHLLCLLIPTLGRQVVI